MVVAANVAPVGMGGMYDCKTPSMNRATVVFGTNSEAMNISKAHTGMSEENPKKAMMAANEPILCLITA
ncbi:hypothetical protein Heshes_23560 [Alicyclobacillus hesperidum]|uniref:Uncharacterized protein n=1 Tax=Alicyclobacillus hesperidum TaxID=89784 RepID=A0AA37TZI5_9BACL|nr:hypothetical protein Heshes_23560 [Alicyclobacillus hesperidum]